MHNLLGPDWLFYGLIAAYMSAPYVAAIGAAVGIYYTWRALRKRRSAEKRKALK